MSWHPVLPSQALRPANEIVAGFLHGEELALWRSVDGVAQAWENRCPHRGTRLTLGRILDGKLSCAYHGWEFEADSAECSRIPAQPEAAVPRGVCVKTWRAAEVQGMVWVSSRAIETAAPVLAEREERQFCRSLSVRVAGEVARPRLLAQGFAEAEPGVWRGALAGVPVLIYLNEAKADWSMLHLFTCGPDDVAAVIKASRRLRETMEEGA